MDDATARRAAPDAIGGDLTWPLVVRPTGPGMAALAGQVAAGVVPAVVCVVVIGGGLGIGLALVLLGGMVGAVALVARRSVAIDPEAVTITEVRPRRLPWPSITEVRFWSRRRSTSDGSGYRSWLMGISVADRPRPVELKVNDFDRNQLVAALTVGARAAAAPVLPQLVERTTPRLDPDDLADQSRVHELARRFGVVAGPVLLLVGAALVVACWP